MSEVCVCTTSLVKINKSVSHLYAMFDRHNTVHLGPERKYLELKRKDRDSRGLHLAILETS